MVEHSNTQYMEVPKIVMSSSCINDSSASTKQSTKLNNCFPEKKNTLKNKWQQVNKLFFTGGWILDNFVVSKQ